MAELEIGSGCGMKLHQQGVLGIAAFNSGGDHISTLKPQALRALNALGLHAAPDELQDIMWQSTMGNTLQPGLDAGHLWLKEIESFAVSTTDAMTPPTNNPELFGRIAALHVMSDLWVSGVEPRMMQQYLDLPARIDQVALRGVLKGFKDTCEEHGTKITGGQTREDGREELLIGGTAIGFTRERQDINTPRIGDVIVMTKALGTSVAIAAHKMIQQSLTAGLPDTARATIQAAEASMATDNHLAVMMRERGNGISSCTDITGFGLIGHLSNLVKPVGKGAIIELDKLPLIEGVVDLVGAAHTHAGDKAQIDHADWQDNLDMLNDPRFHLAMMPETSGGVVATMWPNLYQRLANTVEDLGQTLTVIGKVVARNSLEDDSYRFAGIELI